MPYRTTSAAILPRTTPHHTDVSCCFLPPQIRHRRPCIRATEQRPVARCSHPEDDRRHALPVAYRHWKREVGSRGEDSRVGLVFLRVLAWISLARGGWVLSGLVCWLGLGLRSGGLGLFWLGLPCRAHPCLCWLISFLLISFHFHFPFNIVL